MTVSPIHGSGLLTMASLNDQNRFRQPMTSPTRVCTPRNPPAPVQSSAFMSRPAMKSSFTARRVQPCRVKRGRKPDCGKKALILSTSPYMKTFSHGTSTLSKTKMVSFSSMRLDSG